jgi:uncharacterized membrane protein
LSFLKFIKKNNSETSASTEINSQKSDLQITNLLICHRIHRRTFNFRGYYFPVCSRCTGLYIGVFVSFIYINLYFVNYSLYLFLSSVFMIIPTVIDGFSQFYGFRESNNNLRFFTGLIAGFGLVFLIYTIKWLIIMN